MPRISRMLSFGLAVTMLVAGMSTSALAAVPEIDPASGASALTLVGGLLLAARGYRRS